LRALRPDLLIRDVRGNVDTRLRKWAAGEYDALVLAAAGLVRLDLAHLVTAWLAPDLMLPAVGQGALAVENRVADRGLTALLAPLDDAPTRAAVTAERSLLAMLGAGCAAAVGAHATVVGTTLTLTGLIGAPDGRLVRGARTGARAAATEIGAELGTQLLAQGRVFLVPAGEGEGGGDE
jgi:hydroxymethylbilane synthase